MENDNLTTDILSEVRLVRDMVYSGEFGHRTHEDESLPWDIYHSQMAAFWLTGNAELLPMSQSAKIIPVQERQKKTPSQQLSIALANICLALATFKDLMADPIEHIDVERDRQVNNGDSIESDIEKYGDTGGNELKLFAIHRLTGDDAFYPFSDPHYKNSGQDRGRAEELIQAGALLLAVLQIQAHLNAKEEVRL